jgi:hypothetical protein
MLGMHGYDGFVGAANRPSRGDAERTRLERNRADQFTFPPCGHCRHVQGIPGYLVARVEAHRLDEAEDLRLLAGVRKPDFGGIAHESPSSTSAVAFRGGRSMQS